MYKLSLVSVDVSGDVIDMLGSISVTIIYHNSHQFNLESTYTFCLDPNAVIDSLSVTIGNKKIVGVVEEKKQAQRTYTNAIKNKKRSALLEKNEDIYSLFVGNIAGNESIVITYTYLTRLSESDNKYIFAYPTNVGQRYGMTGTKTESDQSNFTGSGVLTNVDFSNQKIKFFFNVRFCSNNTIKNISSTTNKINIINNSSNEKIISLSSESAIGDLSISMETNSESVMYYTIPNQTDLDDKYSYVMINHKIPNELNEIIPKNIYFFLDRSGSMCGSTISDAINALVLAIKTLNNISYFNIISFGSDFYKMFKSSVIASESNKLKAIQMLKKYKADMGCTEIFKCLEHCINNEINNTNVKFEFNVTSNNKNINNMEKIFFFLTDGEVSNQNLVMDLLRSSVNVRIFSIGIGSSVSRSLIQNMSDLTSGLSKIAIDSKNITNVVSELFGAIYKKYYTNISLIINGNMQNTIGCNCLYPNMTANILLMIENTTFDDVALTGFDKDEQKYWNINLESKITIDPMILKKQIANELIRKKQISNDQIINLSKKYNIMNELTSFVLVESVESVTSTDLTDKIESFENDEFDDDIDDNYNGNRGIDMFGGCDEEVDALEGGIDMFGGGGHYINKYDTQIKWIEIDKLFNSSNYSYKFHETSWILLRYLSQEEFDKHATATGLTRVLLFNMIILNELIKINKKSDKAIKLLEYFNLKYPDMFKNKSTLVKQLYDDYIQNLNSQKIYVGGGGGDY